LTYGRSSLLEKFFRRVKDEIYFEVVVCETAPSFGGHLTAENLIKEGINTTLIPDSAVYALMSRVDKVIFSAHAIMANGGLVTHSGAHMIALAA
jgi:translation initiation factor eIF-2B subunit beta